MSHRSHVRQCFKCFVCLSSLILKNFRKGLRQGKLRVETLVGDLKDKEISISQCRCLHKVQRERGKLGGERERERGLEHVLVRSDTRSQDLIEIYR